MGRNSKIKHSRKFDKKVFVTNDRDKLADTATNVVMDGSDDFTNLNLILSHQVDAKSLSESNLLLICNQNMNGLAAFSPHPEGSVPMKDWFGSIQEEELKRNNTFRIACINADPTNEQSAMNTISCLESIFKNAYGLKTKGIVAQVLNTIGTGIKNGAKWVLLADIFGNIRCCLHPETIRYWNSKCV